MGRVRNYLFVVLLAAVLLLTACGGQNGAPDDGAPPDESIATSVHETTSALAAQREQEAQNAAATEAAQNAAAPTEEPQVPTDTPAPINTDTPEPTIEQPTEEPTETPIPDDGRVSFAEGMSYTTIKEQMGENTTVEYVVNIAQGRVLSVFVEADGKVPALGLVEEDGKELLDSDKGFNWYITTAQKTQDYTIKLVSADFTSNYVLHIGTLIDVIFDEGAASKTIEGELKADDIVEYKAYAVQDQKAKITLTSTSGKARLYIYGFSAYEEYVTYDDNATSWETVLPETQTYLIKVIANDADTDYTLTLEFTD